MVRGGKMSQATENKRVFAYARVSTSNQEKGLEAQLRSLNDYCKRMGITDFTIFTDENQSGAKTSRPGLDAMMEAVRRGEAKTVIVYSFSRYARSVTHLLKALEEFDKLNISFISLTEAIDTSTPLGRSVFVILGAVAQLERDLIRERVRNGLANAKAKGVRLGRLKTRPSEMIRILRQKGQTYRQISLLLGVSSGAVSAEVRAMKKEIAEGKFVSPLPNQKVVATEVTNKNEIIKEEPREDFELTRY
jgi:DNA invertase Pin-like site-specific DNA recombinase